ncbi:MAG: histidine phosphatase family protein [Deltaproteobacteria bacterium]|nr:histidine phosphatase family protein [Deltaproteobacteria bacterium]TLN02842.1 MAG: histidine phosphatase family protein [bacterium]
MKRLALIRHAKSSWKDPNCADFDRPLTKRGKADAVAAGRWFAERRVQPSLIVASPAKRAIATLKRIVVEMGLPEKKIVRVGRLYEADSRDLLDFVREIDDSHDECMLCGHNPALTDFCNYLAGYTFDNLPTCGVIIIDVMVDTWRDVQHGSGRILSWNRPRKTHRSDVVPADH